MSRKTPSIPATNGISEPIVKVLEPIKQNIEFANGTRATKIARLGLTSTLSDVINKVNDIIDRMQGER